MRQQWSMRQHRTVTYAEGDGEAQVVSDQQWDG